MCGFLTERKEVERNCAKKFCNYVTARVAFTDSNLLVVAIGEPKIFSDAVLQNLTYLKFSLQFLRENSSITCSKLKLRLR